MLLRRTPARVEREKEEARVDGVVTPDARRRALRGEVPRRLGRIHATRALRLRAGPRLEPSPPLVVSRVKTFLL